MWPGALISNIERSIITVVEWGEGSGPGKAYLMLSQILKAERLHWDYLGSRTTARKLPQNSKDNLDLSTSGSHVAIQ